MIIVSILGGGKFSAVNGKIDVTVLTSSCKRIFQESSESFGSRLVVQVIIAI
jgi:hypothetical protein